VTLADIIIDLGAPGKGAPPGLRWLADWIPDAERLTLIRDDLARIDAYSGPAEELHSLLAAVLPLAKPIWCETTVTAQGGTEMIMGYGAVPAADGVDVGWACYAPAHSRMIGPLGPARVTATEMRRPSDISDESWHELRSAAGLVLRAILLRRRH
jgi:hypothetical protein